MNTTKNWRGLFIVGSLCSGLLFLVSSALLLRTHFVPRVPVEDAFGVAEAALRCEERTASCGEFRIGQPVQHTFRLFNMSSETRHILKVVPGCSCAKVTHFSKDVAPQSWGEVAVSIDTTGNPGLRQSSLLIITDDAERPKLNLLVSCEVLPAVETRPRQFRFAPDESTAAFPTQTIEVVGLYRDEKIGLGDIQASDPMISVNKHTSKENDPLHFDVTIHEEMPAGITLAHLIIHVEGSAQKSVRFPMTIANELKMKAEPSTLKLAVDKDSLQTAEFTVKTLDNSPLEVNKVELAGTALHVVSQRTAGNAVLVRLEGLKVTHDLDLRHVRVLTNHGELRVPVSARVRPSKHIPTPSPSASSGGVAVPKRLI